VMQVGSYCYGCTHYCTSMSSTLTSRRIRDSDVNVMCGSPYVSATPCSLD
jgi:hypothetical protein